MPRFWKWQSNCTRRGKRIGARAWRLASWPIMGSRINQSVLPYFESAAASQDWDLREFTQMFFRRLIKQYPAEMQAFLLRLVKSEDPTCGALSARPCGPCKRINGFIKTLSIL